MHLQGATCKNFNEIKDLKLEISQLLSLFYPKNPSNTTT